MDRGFRSDNKQTKEEFLSLFENTSEEITIKVNWAWSKGGSRFDSFGKEDLVHIRFMMPWEANEEHPIGIGGTIYWFSKKKLIGHPYTPHFIVNECYRLRVRRCKNGRNFLLLEDVLESNVDVSADESIYERVYTRYMDRFAPETKDVLIYCVNDVNVSRSKRADGMAIGYAYVDYSAIIDCDNDKPQMVGRCMTVAFDDKKLSANKDLRFKAGKNYKVRVRVEKNNPSAIALDKILEENVENEILTLAGQESLKPVKWPVEGFGEFDISWDRLNMKASKEDISWDPEVDNSEVSIYLKCDQDNCHTAYKTTEAFLNLYKDRKAFENKVFEAVANELSNDEGMVETWSDEAGTITKDEFINRISLSYLCIEPGGVDIMVSLDELFTDHDFSLYMNNEGSFNITGLWG